MKNKKSSSFLQRFDLPEDLSKNGYHIEIFNSCAVVDGCKNVNEYSDGVIRLDLGQNIVSVIGNNLTIRCFSCGQATIDGRIAAVEIS
ncbi:MAG: YabP/YqfC family sporulation protein [Clostridia bacterium]|nr:YabP/YqfC family sporulation protein [Clostridia bacterium]